MKTGYIPCPHPEKHNTFSVLLLLGSVLAWLCVSSLGFHANILFKAAQKNEKTLNIPVLKPINFFLFSEKKNKHSSFEPHFFLAFQSIPLTAQKHFFQYVVTVSSKALVQSSFFISKRAPPTIA